MSHFSGYYCLLKVFSCEIYNNYYTICRNMNVNLLIRIFITLFVDEKWRDWEGFQRL